MEELCKKNIDEPFIFNGRCSFFHGDLVLRYKFSCGSYPCVVCYDAAVRFTGVRDQFSWKTKLHFHFFYRVSNYFFSQGVCVGMILNDFDV